MSDAFAPYTGIEWNGNVGIAQYGPGDKHTVVFFYNRPVHNPAKSKAAGRQIFEDHVFVKMHPPGERLSIIDRPVKDEDKMRFPVQWMQFTKRQEQIPEGTPIEQLYPEQPSIPMMLRAHNVFTIEQCAELSGNAIQNIGMGAQSYVNSAQDYVQKSKAGVSITKHRQDLEARDREIGTLKRMVEDQANIIEQMRVQMTSSPSLEQVQTMVTGLMQRPVYTPSAKFDPQSAMINSTHGSKLQTVAQASSKRTRVRVK